MGENGIVNDPVELWRHPEPESTQIYAFLQHIAKKYHLDLASYDDLWEWSVAHPAAFWEEIWHWTGIKATKPYQSVQSSRCQ